jgi:glycine cleavage system aminomethyltransferase T
MLECGIAFAFVKTEIKLNTACTINIRDKEEPATIVNKRFFKRA